MKRSRPLLVSFATLCCMLLAGCETGGPGTDHAIQSAGFVGAVVAQFFCRGGPGLSFGGGAAAK